MGLYVNNSGVLSPIAGTPTAMLRGLQSQIDNTVFIQNEMGAKNLLPNNLTSPYTINGITYTVNSDGSITANGTASDWASATSMAVITLAPGNYRFWFNRDDYYLFARNGGSSSTDPLVFDNQDEGYFTLDETTTLYVGVTVGPNSVVDNEVLYPMIWHAEDPDDTYYPYARTNKQLTDRELITQVINGNSSVTIAANKSTSYTDFTIPSGYTFLGIVGWGLGNTSLNTINVGLSSAGFTPRLDIVNKTESSITVTPAINVLLRKT